MQLDGLSVQLRPRGGWEALDLGFRMARTWWRPVWAAWLAVYLPIAIALHLAFADRAWIAALALWWLKPMFDRFVLHVVSRSVFGAQPSLAATLAAWRDILRPGLVAGLTVFRLSPVRSLMLPVALLERQRGREARSRRAVLGKRMRGYAVWLTLVCIAFEIVVFLSLDILVTLFAPVGADPGFEFWEFFKESDEEIAWGWFDSAFYVLAVCIVEPLYVAAGFSLYLSRRAILEGWDIEVRLRRIHERLGGPATIALLVAVCVGLTAPAPAAVAATNAEDEIAEILKAPEFQQYRDGMEWRYRGQKKEGEQANTRIFNELARFLAEISQALLWIVAIIGGIALFFMARRYLPGWLESKATDYRPPNSMFGLDVAPESLPDDVAATALGLVREGRVREALSLLYRGALSALIHRDHVQLAAGDTEGDCLRAARGKLPDAGANYLTQLVRAWSNAAYAARMPAAAEAEALARAWPPHFALPSTLESRRP